MALSGLMAIVNLLIFLLSVPLKMAEVLRRKCGRPERGLRRPVVSSLFGSKSIMRRRLMNASFPPKPLSGAWNMQVSDGTSNVRYVKPHLNTYASNLLKILWLLVSSDELEVATILNDGKLDILASSTPFKPPTPTRTRGVGSLLSSQRTLK